MEDLPTAEYAYDNYSFRNDKMATAGSVDLYEQDPGQDSIYYLTSTTLTTTGEFCITTLQVLL